MKKRVLGSISILVGLALIFNAIFTERSNTNKENDLRATFEDSLLHHENDDNKPIGSRIDIQSIKIPEGEVSAVVSIPKIELEVAIIEGIDMDKLNYALEHFSETANPGQNGNFAIAGHNNWISGAFFARLDELEPEDVWILDPTDGPIITLQTCTIGGQQRLIVRGELESTIW